MARSKKINFDPEIVEAEENLLIDFQFLVQQLMDEKGMARVELAKKAGISKAQLSQLLSSEANPTVKTFARIFHALGEKLTWHCAIEPKEVPMCPPDLAVGEWRVEPAGTDISEPKRARAKKAHVADLLKESIVASNDNQQRALTMESDTSSFELKAA